MAEHYQLESQSVNVLSIECIDFEHDYWQILDCWISTLSSFAHKIAIISFCLHSMSRFNIEDNSQRFYRFPLFFSLQDVRFPENGREFGSNRPWGLTSRLKEIKCVPREFAILKEGDENLLLRSKEYNCSKCILQEIVFYYFRHFIATPSVIKMGESNM